MRPSPTLSHRSPSLLRPARRGALIPSVLAGLALLPAGASAAPAGDVEIVSRAWGAQGAAPYSLTRIGDALQGGPALLAGVASDDGRYSAFTWARDGETVFTPDQEFPLFLRDIVKNQTIEITSQGLGEATAIDRANRLLSYEQGTFSTGLDGTPTSSVWIYDLKTGSKTLVSRATGASGAPAVNARGRISGDGKSVVFEAVDLPGSGPGVYRRVLATGVTTRIGDRPAGFPGLGPRLTSVSDDGRVAGLTTFGYGADDEGLVISPQGAYVVNGAPYVAPDGASAAYLRPGASRAELISLDTATGAKTLLGEPRGADGTLDLSTAGVVVGWVSPDGKEVAVVPRTIQSSYTAQLFDRRTGSFRSAGPYGGLLSRWGSAAYNQGNAAISRNGRFATVPLKGTSNFSGVEIRGLAQVDTHGWKGLPGGADLPSVNHYFTRSGLQCPLGPTIDRIQAKIDPAPGVLPKATSVRGVVTFGGTTALDATVTSDETADVVIPAGATKVTIKITASFAGRGSITDTYAFPFAQEERCEGR